MDNLVLLIANIIPIDTENRKLSMYLKPTLKIIVNPSLNTYDVEAAVLVPNGCYLAAGSSATAPEGQYVLPEAQPITLRIEKHDGICTQAERLLTFRVPWLPLNPAKRGVVAFVTVNDEIVGITSKPILEIDDAFLSTALEVPDPCEKSGVVVQSVNAWINAMPPGPPRLIAITNVYAPCINFEYSYRDLGPFGITEKTLRVALVAALPGACERAIFEGPVRFEKVLDSADQFTSIALEFEGELYFDPLEITV